MSDLSIRADADQIRRASEWLEARCTEHGVPADKLVRLDLCLNEILANVIAHGDTASARIGIRFRVRADGAARAAVLTVSDAGPPFDPLAVAPRPRPQTLAEAEPGGLGLLMVRSFADELDYRYSEGCNRLSFGVRWARTTADWR